MSEEILNIIDPKELKIVDSKEIDCVIEKMITESCQDYVKMEELVIECTSALSSAEGMSKALSSRGILKRGWDAITGKENKLRCAIEQDTVAAQYAMQQTLNYILKESTRNRELLFIMSEKINGELLELQKSINKGERETARIRGALVGFYNHYLNDISEIKRGQEEQREYIDTRCEECRTEIGKEQIICTNCGTVQRLKLKGLPKEMQDKFKVLSEIMKSTSREWDVDKCWGIMAEKYAEKANKARAIAVNAGITKEKTSLFQDIDNLIKKCQNSEFQIAVVGVLKAGKSMLMNALIGLDLASTGLNSKTAALTKFRSSSNGHYVKVTFYTEKEWMELKKSARISGNKNENEEDSFLKYLQRSSVIREEKKWINHQSFTERFSTIDSFKKAIERWTAADSEEHLFAKTVEVGIDKSTFDMPEEVVFVDTPGLQDPVRYRSKITERYISKADAVLVAVPISALTEEGFSTITRVLDHAGSNTNKVYIVGTQKDKLQSVNDYEEIISEWISKLVEAKRYKSDKEASKQIFATSAYMHLCMKKTYTLSVDELEDESKFPYDDYINFRSYVTKLINATKSIKSRREYVIENLRHDQEALNIVAKGCSIELLKRRIETDLIEKYRQLKIEDISRDFSRCKKQILVDAIKNKNQCEKIASDAEKGVSEIRNRLKQVKDEKKQLEQEKAEIEETLNMLRQFTENRIANGRSIRR